MDGQPLHLFRHFIQLVKIIDGDLKSDSSVVAIQLSDLLNICQYKKAVKLLQAGLIYP